MITIEQLLESVDLDFEPKWITKDSSGIISIFAERPERRCTVWDSCKKMQIFGKVKLTEFDGKIWTECIYEVPRKTTGKIARLTGEGLLLSKDENGKATIWTETELFNKINELVNYVDALIESNNIHEKQIDELQMKLEPEKCAVNELKERTQPITLNPDLTDEDLRKMMRDPKYWRDNDPATIQKVQDGFNKLYSYKN